MSGIADHYHKEKEKNQKLMAELQRQNETLERLDKHFKIVQKEKDHLIIQLDKLRDEVAKERTVCDIGKYNSFVHRISTHMS